MKVYVVLFDQDSYGHNYIYGVYSKEQDAKFEIKYKIENSKGRYNQYDFQIHEEDLL